MKRLTLILVALAIAIIIVIPIGLWFAVYEKPIKANPNELMLTTEDLPGWQLYGTDPPEGYGSVSGDAYGYMEWIWAFLHNNSVETGYNLTIGIYCYSSSRSAQDQFKQYWVIPEPSSPTLGDEGGRQPGTGTVVTDKGEFLVSESTYYSYREGNVIVRMQFETVGSIESPLDPNGTYYEPWMDDIAMEQMAKVDSFNIHIL
jgi:hypothetical protein